MRVLSTLLLGVVCVCADFPADKYTVDLDKSAWDRWIPIAEAIIAKHGYENTWAPLHAFLESALPHEDWILMTPLWDKMYMSYPKFYQEEVSAYHKFVTQTLNHTEWTLGQIVMSQLFYEVEDACTSIVAQNANGTIFHGRNLDYGLPGLSNMTIVAEFTRNNKTIARGTVYAGYCGLLTGQHVEPTGATWSLSLNERFYGKQYIPYEGTIEAILAGVQNAGFCLRDALMDKPSYTEATNYLRTEPMAAPSYLTVSGLAAGEGVVITRDRNGTSHAMGTGRGYFHIDASVGDWYRLETNFDNWEPLTDGRRKTAHEGMNSIGATGANLTGFFNVLSTPNLLNDETTYTSLMLNEADYYWTLVRDHSDEVNARRTEEMRVQVTKKMKSLKKWFLSQKWD